MELKDLRPGMEHIDIRVRLVRIDEPREVETNYGITHVLVDGLVEDDSGKMELTIWNEKTEQINPFKVGDMVDLMDCFITSFKGILSINVGRDSGIISPNSTNDC
jgi:replication factor A1